MITSRNHRAQNDASAVPGKSAADREAAETDPGTAGISQATLPMRSGFGRILHGKVDHSDEKGVMDLLQKKRLLDERYFYSAIPAEDEVIKFTKATGTYIQDGRGQPGDSVFCCEIAPGAEPRILQVNNHRYSLFDYLKQNCDLEAAAIAVYDRSALVHRGGAEFGFKDPEKPERALKAILIIDNFAS